MIGAAAAAAAAAAVAASAREIEHGNFLYSRAFDACSASSFSGAAVLTVMLPGLPL